MKWIKFRKNCENTIDIFPAYFTLKKLNKLAKELCKPTASRDLNDRLASSFDVFNNRYRNLSLSTSLDSFIPSCQDGGFCICWYLNPYKFYLKLSQQSIRFVHHFKYRTIIWCFKLLPKREVYFKTKQNCFMG